jgi:hypothetical protein
LKQRAVRAVVQQCIRMLARHAAGSVQFIQEAAPCHVHRRHSCFSLPFLPCQQCAARVRCSQCS